MNSWNKIPSKSILLPLAISIALTACYGGSDETAARKTPTQTINGTDYTSTTNSDDLEQELPAKPITPPVVTEDEIGKVPPIEIEKPMTPIPPMENGKKEEIVMPPVIPSGVTLFCYRNELKNNQAIVFCATEDAASAKLIEPGERYSPFEFSATAPAGLTVTQKLLPSIHRYNVEFTISAPTTDGLTSGLSGMQFFFKAKDLNNQAIEISSKVTNNMRPEMWIQSLLPQSGGKYRCLDRYRMWQALPPQKIQVVTTPCNLDIVYDWYVTPEGKIAHVATGECIAFDPSDKLTVVKGCETADAALFEFKGEQIKVQNWNMCLGLKPRDLSGVDYSALVACSDTDVAQKWKISPRAQK